MENLCCLATLAVTMFHVCFFLALTYFLSIQKYHCVLFFFLLLNFYSRNSRTSTNFKTFIV